MSALDANFCRRTQNDSGTWYGPCVTTDHIPSETDVVIVGAGPVGLALATELGHRGVDCVVVEERERARVAPRAKLVNCRSMEHMRRWGLADEIRAASPLDADYSTDVAFVTSVLGREITRFSNVFFTDTKRRDEFPEPAQQVPQYVVEPILQRRVEETPSATMLGGWRVHGLTQDDCGVEVSMTRTGESGTGTIAARYVVGCDGASSVVRQQLGIELVGDHGFARNYGIVFRSRELTELVPHKPALHFWTVNAQTPSYMGPGDRHDLWWLQATALPEGTALEDLDPVAVLHGAIGRPVDVEILSVDPWHAHALTAERLSSGRVFLAGDAAHLHTPMGAHGMNQGIGDAVDLGWKLAATVQGWGGPTLLESYALERAPLHARVRFEATTNYGMVANHFVRPGLEDDTPEAQQLRDEIADQINRHKRREFYSLGLVLGHVYEGSPLVVPDGTPAPAAEVDSFTPHARPGGRAPHVWLPDGTSLYDRFGRDFTLLSFGGVDRTAPFREAAEAMGVPLACVVLDDPAAAELYDAELALIRPDHVLSWRGSERGVSPRGILETAAGRTPESHPRARDVDGASAVANAASGTPTNAA